MGRVNSCDDYAAEHAHEADGVRHAYARQEAPALARRSLSAAFGGLNREGFVVGDGVKRKVERMRVAGEPHLLWNAFIDLIAKEDYTDLSPLQRKAHLVFWYESEVQNGGHGQYLDNRGLEQLAETIQALRDLDLPCQATVLSRAAAALAGGGPKADWAEVLEDSFIDEVNAAFDKCRPTVTEALERHLAAHSAEYVEQT